MTDVPDYDDFLFERHKEEILAELEAAGDTGEDAAAAVSEELEALQGELEALENRVVVEFWTTDNEEDRVVVYEAVADAYMAENPNVEVRIIPIEEAGVSQRISTAVAANAVRRLQRAPRGSA